METNPSSRARTRALVGGVIVASVLATWATSATERSEPSALAELLAISSKLDARISTVMIEATEPVAYVTSQPDPLTVIVDLRNVRAGVLAQPVGPVPPVTGVEVEELAAPDGATLARIRVTMDRPATHKVRSARNVIYVEVDRTASAATASAAAPARAVAKETKVATGNVVATTAAVARPPAMRAASTLRSVIAIPNGVSLLGDGELLATKIEEAKDLPPRVLLDFQGVTARGVPAVTEIQQGGIQRVRVGVNSRSPLVTRVVIDLATQLAYRIEQVGNELRVLFSGLSAEAPPVVTGAKVDATVAPTPAASTPAAPATRTAPVASAVAPASPTGASAEQFTSAPAVTNGAMADKPGAPVAPAAPDLPADMRVLDVQQAPAPPPPSIGGNATQQPAATGQPRFVGPPVSLDFQGADLRAVLRTFAEISGLNIVIDPSINGIVDVSLRDVPWDQALDIILKANKLGYAVDGTVVRIAPLTILAQEEEERRKYQEAQALAGDLHVLTLPLSYAKAPDLVPILTRSALSTRGEVQVDARTNTLIVRDLPERLTTAGELVKVLDRPQPQVEIEARIVQTTRDFARAIGVQWGVAGRIDPTLGNTTNLAFPNRGSITGRELGVQGPTQGDITTDKAVNLGVSAPTSAIGIALGSVNGALNLDVVLSQLESTGRGRLLSTPRVSTQNNVQAEMSQGVQIPIQTVANNTVTVSFKDATLTLRVTPQITASNTVIMNIFLENAVADFGREVNGIPPIDTQRAVTTVLVGDGETTVIGGIYTSNETSSQDRVPLLHRIPLLGWLFKRDQMSDESRELLIFITPRITRS